MREKKRPFEIHVVLVRSIYERNVGATSRAMCNMGFKNLILIQPQKWRKPAQKALQKRLLSSQEFPQLLLADKKTLCHQELSRPKVVVPLFELNPPLAR